jgi:hypothetical protein
MRLRAFASPKLGCSLCSMQISGQAHGTATMYDASAHTKLSHAMLGFAQLTSAANGCIRSAFSQPMLARS